MHPYLQLLQQDERKFDADLLEQSENTVCFWATNGMEALDLPERREGRRWINSETDFQRGLHYDDDTVGGDSQHSTTHDDYSDHDAPTRHDILAFTFRVDIPSDLPHSVHATTCRYFYTANILVKTATQQQILKRSFQVVTPAKNSNGGRELNHDDLARTSARVKFGYCVGLAHSNGLPCHLSTTEIHRPKGQLVVVQNHCLAQQYQHNTDVQTLRISNAVGRPVCILTVIGSQSLSPGARVHLQWDFPKEFRQDRCHDVALHTQKAQNDSSCDDHNRNDHWIPCHLVCACLQGEEFAIFEDGSKKRTQSFLFDTCHEWVEPGSTDRISKTLWLSSSNSDEIEGNTSLFEGGTPPCDLKTDVMEVSTWCQVDITIREQNISSGSNDGYNNLSLRIPCRVRHSSSLNDQQEEQDMMEQQVEPLNELLNLGTEHRTFPTNDIRSDLKTLSLKMEEMVCGGNKTVNDR